MDKGDMENAITSAVAAIIEQQIDLQLGERMAETLRAAAFLAVTEVEGVTSAIFGEAAELVGAAKANGARNRFNESKAIWGDEFKFQG